MIFLQVGTLIVLVLVFGHAVGRHTERTNRQYEEAVAGGLDPDLARKSTAPGWLVALTAIVFMVGAWQLVKMVWQAVEYWT